MSPIIQHSQSLAFCRLCSPLEISLQSSEKNQEWCEAFEDYFRRSLSLGYFASLERIRLLELCGLLFPSYPFLMVEILNDALGDPDYRVRKASFEKLSNLLQETTFSDGNAQKSMSSKALRLAVQHTTKDPSSKVRVSALSIFSVVEESFLVRVKGAILSKLLDKDDTVRKLAKKILCESPLFYLLEEEEQARAFESILRFSFSEQDYEEAGALLLDWLEIQHENPTRFLARLNVYQSPAFDQISRLFQMDIETYWRKKGEMNK